MDDYSRMVWVYLLQFKSEFCKVMKAFYNHVETHFELKIKMLRTDNALEFKDSQCVEFYTAKGMVHQASCPYKPQQNA